MRTTRVQHCAKFNVTLRNIASSPEKSLETVRTFENAMAAEEKACWAVGVNSCTSGILTALMAIGIGRGDEVIVPALSWPQTWFPVTFLGATLVPVDLAPDFPAMNPALLDVALSAKTKAVISVGLWGFPAGIAEIDQICQQKGLPHILDAAQLSGIHMQGFGIGNLADMSVASLASTKRLLPCGEGGVVLVRNNPMYHDRLLYSTQHPVRICEEVEDLAMIWDGGKEGFNLNLRIHPFAAAIGLQQLRSLKKVGKDLLHKHQQIVDMLAILELPELVPSLRWAMGISNKSTVLLDSSLIPTPTLVRLEHLAFPAGARLQPCIYPLITRLRALENSRLFPWMKHRSCLRSKVRLAVVLNQAERWARDLLVITGH